MNRNSTNLPCIHGIVNNYVYLMKKKSGKISQALNVIEKTHDGKIVNFSVDLTSIYF